jgi:Ca2+-binding RTX toxin-like protein
MGSAGVDTLSGGDGNDIIIGGDGADLINLANDGDTDILVYNDLSEAGDTVNGFVVGTTPGVSDIIDLSDLFTDGTVNDVNIGSYVQVAGGTLSVDPGGLGNFAGNDLADLTGVVAGNIIQISIDGEDLTVAAS